MPKPKLLLSHSHPFLPLSEVKWAQQQLLTEVELDDDAFSRTLQLLFTQISGWLFVESISILLYDGPMNCLRLCFVTDSLGSIPQESQAPGEHLTGKAFSDNAAIISNNLEKDIAADQDMVKFWGERLSSRRLKSAVFIPFFASLECSGVFRVFNRLNEEGDIEDGGFTEEDVKLLSEFVGYASALLAVLWERRQLQKLNTLLSLLPSKKNVRILCDEVAHAVTGLANSASAIVYLLDESDVNSLRLAGRWGLSKEYKQLKRFPVKGSIAGRVAATGSTIQIKDLRTEPGVANREIGIQEKWISCVVIPIRGASTKGALAVFSRSEKGFQHNTISVLETLGLFVGNLLDARSESIRTEHLRKVLGHIGHSLRSPLAGISRSAADIRTVVSEMNLEGKPDKIDKIRTELVDLYRELARADRRIDSLLFAQPGIVEIMGLNIETVDVSTILTDCVGRHQVAAKNRNVRLVLYDSAKKLPQIRGDYEKLDIAFDNLLENAIKYSWKDESVEIRGWFSAREIRVSVGDRGLGIPKSHQELIFDAFTRSDILDSTRYISGTGLGLELVKSILEAHGGEVEVKSEPFLNDPKRQAKMDGFETVFTVKLPRKFN